MKRLALPLFCTFLVLSMLLLQLGSIFLLLAMLPTLVVYFMDSELFKVVGACNLAVTLPYLAPMMHTGLHAKHYDVFFLMSDPAAWMFIYSGAAAGWCLVFLCRIAARFIISLLYQYNIASLQGLQEDLVREWGQQIKQAPGG